MKGRIVTLVSALIGLGLASGMPGQGTAAEGADKQFPRIGVYDSRAITVAYTNSRYNDGIMVKKSTEKKKAEKAGELEKARQIDEWMTWFSIHRHSQGFGTTPVHDLLEPIQKKLPQIAREAGADVIVSKWDLDYTSPDIQIVDVTDRLVRAFEPKPEAYSTIEQIQKIEPLSMEEIVRHELEGGH